MKVHIYHHFDADGFCSAAVLLKYLLHDFNRDNILFYVCEHNGKMDFSKIGKDDIVFIVDYSFPDCDKEELKHVYDDITNDIYWIDHHKTSNKIIRESRKFAKMAEKGLVETSNNYAGCLLTYLWCLMHKMVDTPDELDKQYMIIQYEAMSYYVKKLFDANMISKIYSMTPLWVQLVSDHDTFRHKIDGSMAFAKGLSVKGLYEVFISSDSQESFVTYDDLTEANDLINSITYIGEIIIHSDEKKNKSLVKGNGFEAKFKVVANKSNGYITYKTYNVMCLNGYGNSTVFGECYDRYDAVCIFNYTGTAYKYSMYARERSLIDCSKIALYFNQKYGMNGGGHAHAAGWSAPCNIFDDTKTIEIDVD